MLILLHFLVLVILYTYFNHFSIIQSVLNQVSTNKFKERLIMANNNHKANQKNANRGTSGNNKANGKANGNRGKQMNPNQKGKK